MSRTDADFDPTTVPVYPVVPIELRQVGTEPTQRVYVNGRQIDVPADTSPKDAALAAAAAEAATQMGDAIRVHATTPTGETWRMIVHADGRAWDLPSTPAARRRPWLWPAIASATVAVLAVGADAAVLANRDHGSTGAGVSAPQATPTPSGTPTELPVLPPEGWSSHARWSSPTLADPDAPVLVLPDRAVVATESELVAMNTITGAIAWRSSLPAGGLSAGPAVAHLGDGPSIVAQSDDDLLWWPTRGSTEPHRIPLPTGAELSTDGAAVLARVTDTKAAIIDGQGAVQDRVVPAGAQALAGNVDGTITAASDSGLWWHVDNARLAKDGTPLATPAKGANPLKVAGYAGHHLVMLWTLADGSLLAAVYDDSASMRLVTTARLGGHSDDPDWHASPTRTWGVVGNVMVDLESGKTRELGDWTTTKINNEAAYGDNGKASNKLAVDRNGQTHLLTDESTIPVALLPSGDALVVGDDGTASRLYLVPPKTP
jgi:hypothetical protein